MSCVMRRVLRTRWDYKWDCSLSGLCSASELESSRGGSIRIQHVTGLSSALEGKSRFPKLDECAHFHYEHVEIGPIQVSIVDDEDLKPLSNETDEEKLWSLSVTSQNKTWLVRRSYDNFRMLDQQLHRCIYDRKFSDLPKLPAESTEEKENLHKLLTDYVSRFSAVAGSQINCGPILNWLELDNRGHRLIVPDTDNCPINTPAVAAAYSVKRYIAQAPDEISFEVGDMISVIDMPPSEESIWWRGKRGFQVGFFPCECVAVIGDKVPKNLQFSPQISQPTKPVLRKHGKLIAFFRSFILSRPSRRRLKQSGILKERVFGCDLGEHLLNSGHEIPMVLKCCVEFIESHGLVDGIYRLSGVTSNIQKLRNAFDEDRVPALYEDEAILQDVHSVASLLKMYFRELPNPLCTYQLYHHFVGAVQATQGDDTRLLKMRDVVQKLPPPHYRTLEYLMRHLARVSEKGHETGMTSRNVAIVWAPNLLRCKELEVGGVAALQGVGVQAVVTEFLVCYADLIFCDKLPHYSFPPQQACSKKSRPKSLAISTPTKLLSLEEARSRALLQAGGKVEQDYIEVGGGPASLPPKYHTVIDLPGGSRKRIGSKRSPIGWKMLFGKSGRGSQSRKEIENKTLTTDLGLGPNKAVTELDLTQARRRLRPAKSVESLTSNRNSASLELSDPPGGFSSLEDTLSPMLLRNNEGKSSGHNRSVSHESYFDQLQDLEEDVALDISEIQVNFDLEESEMRIFSEDETLMSVGSGSLASNNSPRILPTQKVGKALVNTINKRLSYPKLITGKDRFCTSQSADPSPKKQKINDVISVRSKLEEQLSSSVGDIQFIDSVSPDQVLVQAEVHLIQSPSPVSSLSRLSSALLAPSSPILPHIPHLTTNRPQSQVIENRSSEEGNACSEVKDSSEFRSCTNSEEFILKDRPISTVSNDLSHHIHLAGTSLTDTSAFDNGSFSLQSSELTTPETPMCQSYTPLVDLEESSVSNMTTPDFDPKCMNSSSETENLEKTMISVNVDFDNCHNVGMECVKLEGKVLSNESEEIKEKCENEKASFTCKIEEIIPPKPEERKPKPLHPYANIPIAKRSEEIPKVLETSFDLVETSSNRNSVISIKYEIISTESSCDSLINVNRGDEISFLLGTKSTNPSPSEPTQSENLIQFDLENSGEKEKKESEMNLLKECSDWLQAKQEFYLTDIQSSTDAESQSSLNVINSFASDNNEFPSFINTLNFSASSEDLDSCEFRMSENNKTDLVEHYGKSEISNDSFSPNFFPEFVGRNSEVEGDREFNCLGENSGGKSESDYIPQPLVFDKLEKKILETNLDEILDFRPTSPKKNGGKPVAKKRTSPQKSNSSGNVRQLLSKFEISPTTEKPLIDFKSNLEDKEKLKENNFEQDFLNGSEVKNNIEERPKTLERLSTKRKTDKDSRESPEVLIEKSKSGSYINQKSTDTGKPDTLFNCDFDLSDPQRRERIEKYKEKRRNYLREKYRSDSFKNEKDDFVLRIKPRVLAKQEEEVEKGTQSLGKSARTYLHSAPNERKSSEKKSPEKLGRISALSKSMESPTKEFCRISFSGELSGRQRYESPTISSSIREQANKRNNFLRFSSERKSAGDFRSCKNSPEKKNLDFSLGISQGDKLSPELLDSFYSRRRMTEPSRPEKCSSTSSDLTRSHKSSSSKLMDGSTMSPPFCIKDMKALFEKRDDSKTHKQYLSSV